MPCSTLIPLSFGPLRMPSSAVSVGRRLATASDSKTCISVRHYSVFTARRGTRVGLSPRILLAVLDGSSWLLMPAIAVLQLRAPAVMAFSQV